jgi:hypothetical protein
MSGEYSLRDRTPGPRKARTTRARLKTGSRGRLSAMTLPGTAVLVSMCPGEPLMRGNVQ